MNQQKPKKALRGLFTRTEPVVRREEADDSDVAPAVEATPVVVAAPAVEAAPVFEAVPAVEAEAVPVAEEPAFATLEAAEAEAVPAGSVAIEVTNTLDSFITSPASDAATPFAEALDVASPPPIPTVLVESASGQGAGSVTAGCDVTSIHAPAPISPVDALAGVVNGFNASVLDRSAWAEDQYLTFIRRIDQAQTEAFLLKGKLLEEVKRRFFVDNKQGWKRFCDDRLDMNYTTANQYIRVAEEFDSLARERPDFGFEHFKALLPLPADQRTEILARSEALSVKTIRRLVQEKMAPTLTVEQAQTSQEARSLVRNLEQLKEQLLGGNYSVLPQLTRWQLAAACQNLSEELHSLASMLNKNGRDATGRIGASARDGETAL